MGAAVFAQLDLLGNESISGGSKFHVIEKRSPDTFVMTIPVEKTKSKGEWAAFISKKTEIQVVNIAGI